MEAVVAGQTAAGLAFDVILAMLFFGILYWRWKKIREKGPAIVALAIILFLTFFAIGPVVSPLIDPFLPVTLSEKASPIQTQAVTGNLKLCFYDPLSNTNITSGSVYLVPGTHDVSFYDQIKKGELQASKDYYVMTLGSSGCVTFRSMTGYAVGGKEYTWFYSGDSANSYPFSWGTVVAYGKEGDTGYLSVKGGDITIYKYSDVVIFDPSGVAKTGYTSSSLTLDLTTKIGPSTENTAVSNVYFYMNYDDTQVSELSIYVNGHEITFTKVSDLDSDNPLRKNAGSYSYVSSSPVITDLLIYNANNRPDFRAKVEATTNTTITIAPVMNANVEYGETPLGTLTIRIDTSATSGFTG